MLPTSLEYKQMIYTREFARHFLPEIILQVIDTSARGQAMYTASSSAFYSKFSELVDEVTKGKFDYGTLEDFQFLLDGTKRLMPSQQLIQRQYGWSSEHMSNATGTFDTPEELVCNYEKLIITAGRVLYFDESYDSVPKDFDLIYYRKGAVLTTIPIRDNESYNVLVTIPVRNYDRLVFKFYGMTKPYRRVHIIEDIPGLYYEYGENEVISISLNQLVDVFSRELIAGELNFMVENANKTLNILNDEGVEKYLQRRQPIDVSLRMIFPDGSTEKVPLGAVKLSEWKVPRGGLEASFTARDATDSLALDEYVKGVFSETPVSLYELAEAVLKDANIGSYTIDIQLLNIYTTAPLPIATHKELLRMIAQAGMSVVLPQVDGGIHLKYISPLVSATNLVLNPGFDNDWKNWTTHTNCAFNVTYIYTGGHSVQLNTGAVLSQTISSLYVGHKYYIRTYVTIETEITGTGTFLYANGTAISVDMADANIQIGEWTVFSNIVTATAISLTVEMRNGASAVLCDGFMCIDLTATYGEGNEPTVDWCNENIRFFNTVLLVPRVKGPAAVDTLDYWVLLDSPEISTSLPTKSVEANIYTYKAAVDQSEIYKGARFVSGTETFTIKFNSPAKNCTVEVHSLDDTGEPTTENTATLLSSTVYAQAAILKVQANSEVQITVKGNSVSLNTSQFKVDPAVDTNLQLDAKAEIIDNRLITNKTVAEDCVSYALYWYNQRYTYDFDWRQNPAVEILDPIKVYDDFGKNNTILVTERTIEYNDGVLGGSSKGVC